MRNLLLFIPIVLLSCTSKVKTLDEYRQEAKAIDTELCKLLNEKEALEAVLDNADSIKKSNPYFNLDSAKIEVSKIDSMISVKSKHLKEIEDICQKEYKDYSI